MNGLAVLAWSIVAVLATQAGHADEGIVWAVLAVAWATLRLPPTRFAGRVREEIAKREQTRED